MMNPFSSARLVRIVAIIMLGCAGHAMADDLPIPTALAKRGGLMLDDDGSMDRGGKTIRSFGNGVSLKSALGTWERST